MTDESAAVVDPVGSAAAEAGPAASGASPAGSPADGTETPGANPGATRANAGEIPATDGAEAQPRLEGGDASLLALIDRLTGLLERSDLEELEVESGGTALILRKPSAVHQPVVFAAASAPSPGAIDPATHPIGSGEAPHQAHTAPVVERKAVVAPLTGIFYAAPSPGSAPYVKIGSEVAVGQVIGLIEAMKLFNEIKSDVAGRVARIPAENGQLIKAKQPIIEVEPL